MLCLNLKNDYNILKDIDSDVIGSRMSLSIYRVATKSLAHQNYLKIHNKYNNDSKILWNTAKKVTVYHRSLLPLMKCYHDNIVFIKNFLIFLIGQGLCGHPVHVITVESGWCYPFRDTVFSWYKPDVTLIEAFK